MPRPLDKEISARRRRRERLAAQLQAEDAALAALLMAQAKLIEAVVEEQRLTAHVNSRTLASEHMQADSRSLAISAGGKRGRDPFLSAIRAKGYTLRSLAGAIGTLPSLLSMQRKGDRPIPTDRAEQIQALTGWPADRKHWPGGLS